MSLSLRFVCAVFFLFSFRHVHCHVFCTLCVSPIHWLDSVRVTEIIIQRIKRKQKAWKMNDSNAIANSNFWQHIAKKKNIYIKYIHLCSSNKLLYNICWKIVSHWALLWQLFGVCWAWIHLLLKKNDALSFYICVSALSSLDFIVLRSVNTEYYGFLIDSTNPNGFFLSVGDTKTMYFIRVFPIYIHNIKQNSNIFRINQDSIWEYITQTEELPFTLITKAELKWKFKN